MSELRTRDIPVFILCGGLGRRLGFITNDMPKPMVTVGDQPILLHLMQSLSIHGFRRFVLCTGHRHEVISRYFTDYMHMHNDFTIETSSQEVFVHQSNEQPDWEVTIANTGLNSLTGARLARAAGRYLGDSEHFLVTYGDGLTNADLAAELEFHLSHQSVGTVLGVQPHSQYGELTIKEDLSASFLEKPKYKNQWINGGFFIFRRSFLSYLSTDSSCVLEGEPMHKLSSEGQLKVFKHDGFWASMDTIKDRDVMNHLCESGAPPWLGKVRA